MAKTTEEPITPPLDALCAETLLKQDHTQAQHLAVRGMALIQNDPSESLYLSGTLRQYKGTELLREADKAFTEEPDRGHNLDALRVKLFLAHWYDRVGYDRAMARKFAREAAHLAGSLKQRRFVLQAKLIFCFGWRGGWLVGPLP